MTAASTFVVKPTDLLHVLEHQFRRNRATWTSALLIGVMNPVLMMLALGFGLGSQIDDTSSLGTSDYLHFVGPGVLAGAAMLQGGMFSLWPTMSLLKWEGSYQSVVRTPATPTDVATGHLIWVALRVGVSSTVFYFVLALAMGWEGWQSLLVPLVAALSALSMAAPITAYSARADTEIWFSVIARLVITPLFVFSGTFTSVDQLPNIIVGFIRLTPGYHGIELSRGFMNGTIALSTSLGHFLVLSVWAIGGWVLAVGGFRSSLTP